MGETTIRQPHLLLHIIALFMQISISQFVLLLPLKESGLKPMIRLESHLGLSRTMKHHLFFNAGLRRFSLTRHQQTQMASSL